MAPLPFTLSHTAREVTGARTLLLFLALLFPAIAISSQIDNRLTPDEQAWLATHPTLRLAPDPDFQPIEWFDEQGRYLGIAADHIQLVEKRLGIRFDIVQMKNWDEVTAAAKSRDIDLWGAASPTDERRQYMLFTQPMLSVPAVIINRQDAAPDLTMEALADKRVTVVSGYAAHDYLKQHYPTIALDVAPDLRTALRRVAFGKSDAMVGNLATASYYMQREGITNLQVAGESGYHYEWALAVRSDWPELQRILDKGLELITPSERAAIMDSWIHLGPISRPWWQLTQQQMVIFGSLIGLASLLIILAWNLGLRREVTQRTEELQRLLREQRLILDNSKIGILLVKRHKIVWANPMVSRLRGLSSHKLQGADTRILYDSDEDYQRVEELFREQLATGKSAEIELSINNEEKGSIWILCIGQAIDPTHPEEGAIWLLDDITERRELRERLKQLAYTDSLTGTLTRRAFVEKAEEKLRLQRRYPLPFSLLMLDIDHFKQVNDNHGHAVGDRVLVTFAENYRSALRDVDIIGRIGGEEFAVILPNTDLAAAELTATRLLELIRHAPIEVKTTTLSITVSIGVTHIIESDRSIDEVLKRADDALYEAKRAGRDCYRVKISSKQS